MRQLVYGIITGGIILVTVLVLCGGNTVDKNKKAAEAASADIKEETEEISVEELLAGDSRQEQLRALYADYPETEMIIRNRSEYCDELIDYLAGHPEAIDWVIQYPEAMAQGTEAIDTKALEPVDVSEYDSVNGIPRYYQWSEVWGYASYGSGQIATDGCGPTSLSMVATGLTGDTSLTPKRIADFSQQEDYYLEDTGTDWSLMSQGAGQLGLKWQEVDWSTSAIVAQLQAGHPIICSMGPGDFTDQGHFIVLSGITADGMIQVNDPNSRINSEKEWSADVLLPQIKGMWAYWV